MTILDEGTAAYQAGDYELAFKILIPLALNNDMTAQIAIASMYSLGEGVEQSYVEAARWYRPAAEQGNLFAIHNLAMMLFSCRKISDLEEAVRWLLIAAQNGLCMSQSVLGDIYSEAYDLPQEVQEKFKSIPEALIWYEKAGDGGFSYAYHRLGEILSIGQGIEKDEEKAFEYFLKAAQEGYEPSQEVLGKAYSEGLLTLSKDSEKSQYWFSQSQHGKGRPLN
jgi:uncharacterized protein